MKNFSILRLANMDFLIRSQQAPNAGRLSREAGICLRTIYRDAEYIRYSMGAPLVYDHGSKGYIYQTDYLWNPLCLLEALQQAEEFIAQHPGNSYTLSFLDAYQYGNLLQWYDYAPSWLNQTKMSHRETIANGYYTLAYAS